MSDFFGHVSENRSRGVHRRPGVGHRAQGVRARLRQAPARAARPERRGPHPPPSRRLPGSGAPGLTADGIENRPWESFLDDLWQDQARATGRGTRWAIISSLRSRRSWTCPTGRSISSFAAAGKTMAGSPRGNAQAISISCRMKRSPAWNRPCKPPTDKPELAHSPPVERETWSLLECLSNPPQHPHL